ncbi:MAG: histidinol-phosphate transaminase [Saprospiraceae bacterium]|nr:histidinol-phosphate transaminase [Saprospiraceae bacterium]
MSNISALVRGNIRRLKPYSSARHEFAGDADIFLDANENPNDNGYNRYPDPLQKQLKRQLCRLKQIDPSQLFLGNGSDEAIDLLIRIFCEPMTDHIITLPPTYGMYKVCADISNVSVIEIPLLPGFQLDVDRILSESNVHSKILFACSPNNPTGNLMDSQGLHRILDSFAGIVVIDEAYIDFCESASWVKKRSQYPNLVILQTMSKAWGLAAIRLGLAIADPEIIEWMNAVKPPYNVNQLTQEKALSMLQNEEEMHMTVKKIVSERERVASSLASLPYIIEVLPSDANFLLIRMLEPKRIFRSLIEKGIVVRDRSTQPLCEGCLRITVGNEQENTILIDTLNAYA